MEPSHAIRPFQPADLDAVVGVWHRAGLAAYPYLPTWQAFTLEHARRVFAEVILPHNQVWVGLHDGRIVAYMAIHAAYIDRLYVDPSEWHQGWGTRFVALAKQLSPSGLELATHQQNLAARALYEKHGFVAVRFGISPPPESAPDVIYQWRP
jgi:ribosomal protein S18 acetylase RimI-like enzyme